MSFNSILSPVVASVAHIRSPFGAIPAALNRIDGDHVHRPGATTRSGVTTIPNPAASIGPFAICFPLPSFGSISTVHSSEQAAKIMFDLSSSSFIHRSVVAPEKPVKISLGGPSPPVGHTLKVPVGVNMAIVPFRLNAIAFGCGCGGGGKG